MFKGLHRHLSEESILLDLDDYLEFPEEMDELTSKQKLAFKKRILELMVKLFDKSGKIVNPSKCLTDMVNREAKATTGLGQGFAMPHVRTMQARDLVMVVMRSERGVYFNSLDDEPVHVFVGLLAPPYNDKLYLRVVSTLSKLVKSGELFEIVQYADSPSQVLGSFCRYQV
jgi:mannitol/fructose-specific phosphotransferase system IIA component (Ntr-type)